MSHMLKQAMIDAKALKESALEVAEQTILEKYAADIKEVVNSLLEQDDEEMAELPPTDEEPGMSPDMGMALGGEEEEGDDAAEFTDQMPASHPTGEASTKDKLNSLNSALEDAEDALATVSDAAESLVSSGLSGDDDEEVEIDFDSLEAAMQGEEGEEGEEADMGDMVDREELVDIEENTLRSLAEELTVDLGPNNSGWPGTPTSVSELNKNLRIAKLQSTALKQENEELQKTLKSLQERYNKTKTQAKSYEDIALRLKDKLNEVNLINAKLFYKNRITENTSLNSKQKTKICEALNGAASMKEVKVLFETLKSSVESTTDKNSVAPKSLNEVIRNKTSLIPRKPSEAYARMSVHDKWQKMAGIKKN